MLRVSLTDLSRLPPERLAKLLLEWAERDRTLLARLHGTVSDHPNEEFRAAAEAGSARSHGSHSGSPGSAVHDSGRSHAARPELLGSSPQMRELSDKIDRFARTAEPVLITGESGTGKELAARALHQRSPRAAGPFAAVNCAAIPPSLIASELFGYEKGAFTGAAARSRGQIEHADGGTLFLDEIGDMPVDMQGYLLRFLQEGQIVRVGGHQAIGVNVRVVAATNVRLKQAIHDGRFREDLYYRLNVLPLELPPLRHRSADIEELAWHFLHEAAAQYSREITGFAPDALELLRRYHWPGNVRELMSAIRRAVVISRGPTILCADLTGLEHSAAGTAASKPEADGPTAQGAAQPSGSRPDQSRSFDARSAKRPATDAAPVDTTDSPLAAPPLAAPLAADPAAAAPPAADPPAAAPPEAEPRPAEPRPVPGSPAERAILLQALAATGENIALTARDLGVSRVTLYRMLRRHGVVPERGFNAQPGVTAALDHEAHSDPSPPR